MKHTPSVDEIILNYLKSVGADGLCNVDYECGCGIEYGLFPCDGSIAECYPAKKRVCKECNEMDNCEHKSEYEAGCYYKIDDILQATGHEGGK